MNLKRRRSPVDYSLCTDTLTVLRDEGGGQYSYKTYPSAFLVESKRATVDRHGQTERNAPALIVIPDDGTGEIPLRVGDKVVRGEEIAPLSREAWAALIPSRVPGMVIVREVVPCYWRGVLTHTEGRG
jgi:hypothetical protein